MSDITLRDGESKKVDDITLTRVNDRECTASFEDARRRSRTIRMTAMNPKADAEAMVQDLLGIVKNLGKTDDTHRQ